MGVLYKVAIVRLRAVEPLTLAHTEEEAEALLQVLGNQARQRIWAGSREPVAFMAPVAAVLLDTAQLVAMEEGGEILTELLEATVLAVAQAVEVVVEYRIR